MAHVDAGAHEVVHDGRNAQACVRTEAAAELDVQQVQDRLPEEVAAAHGDVDVEVLEAQGFGLKPGT